MKEAGLACKTKRRFKATTNSKHELPIAPNYLDRQFSIDTANGYISPIDFELLQNAA